MLSEQVLSNILQPGRWPHCVWSSRFQVFSELRWPIKVGSWCCQHKWHVSKPYSVAWLTIKSSFADFIHTLHIQWCWSNNMLFFGRFLLFFGCVSSIPHSKRSGMLLKSFVQETVRTPLPLLAMDQDGRTGYLLRGWEGHPKALSIWKPLWMFTKGYLSGINPNSHLIQCLQDQHYSSCSMTMEHQNMHKFLSSSSARGQAYQVLAVSLVRIKHCLRIWVGV